MREPWQRRRTRKGPRPRRACGRRRAWTRTCACAWRVETGTRCLNGRSHDPVLLTAGAANLSTEARSASRGPGRQSRHGLLPGALGASAAGRAELRVRASPGRTASVPPRASAQTHPARPLPAVRRSARTKSSSSRRPGHRSWPEVGRPCRQASRVPVKPESGTGRRQRRAAGAPCAVSKSRVTAGQQFSAICAARRCSLPGPPVMVPCSRSGR
jgi:hypothetical protein